MSDNILITSIGGIRGRDLALKIKNENKNLKVFTGDLNKQENMNYFSDGFFVLKNPKNKKKYISHINQIVKKNKIKLIIPGSDDEAILMSEYKNKIERLGAKVATVDFKLLKNFKDKYNTYQHLTKKGLYKIYWEKINNVKELKYSIKKALLTMDKVVLKPIYSRGGRDITIVANHNIKTEYFNNQKELMVSKKLFLKKYFINYKKKFPLIIMQKLKGTPYDVDILAWQGKLIKCVVRKRIGYQGIYGNIIMKHNQKFFDYIKKITKCFNLSWLYDCDVMFDNKNNPILIELNPRISGSVSSSLCAGIPLFSDLIKISKNKTNLIKKNKIKKNKTIISYYSSQVK